MGQVVKVGRVQNFATSLEFSVFCNINYVFRINLQILVGNTPVLVLNFIITVLNTCIVLQVPTLYLALCLFYSFWQRFRI